MAKQQIFSLIIIILFTLVILEFIGYFAINYLPITQIEQILNILKEDSSCIWKQKANLNTVFQNTQLNTNNLGLRNKNIDVNNNNFRIICLGASPTFGWGVSSKKTYPALLEKKLNLHNKNIEVINAGEIGYSSYQGLTFFKKYLLNYKPNLITISYILNDLDQYKFYRNEGVSDNKLSKAIEWMIDLRNITKKSKSLYLLKKSMLLIVNSNQKLSSIILKNQFNLAKTRVSVKDYKQNLKKFITIAKNNNINIIFIKMPVNLSLPTLDKKEAWLIKQTDNISDFYYNEGCNYVTNKDYTNALISFKKAKNYLVFNCHKVVASYHTAMEQVAGRYKIPMVDANDIFNKHTKNIDNLFNGKTDPIHPNDQGHRLIANALTKIIQQSLIKSKHLR